MRKLILLITVMLITSISTMATSPLGQRGRTMSSFKIKPDKSTAILQHTNHTWFLDLTSRAMKDQFTHKGIKAQRTFNEYTTKSDITARAKSPMRENEPTYTLTVKLKYDKNEISYIAQALVMSNDEDKNYWTEDSEDATPAELEFIVIPGNYDIQIIMETLTTDFIVLTASDVEVTGNTEISLDAEDATVEITWNPLLPNGTIPMGTSYVVDPETYDVIEEIPGNMIDRINFLDITNKKHHTNASVMMFPTTLIIDSSKMETGSGNIKTFPDKDYAFYYQTAAIDNNGGYIIPFMATPQHSATLTNDLSNYVTLKPEFAESPYRPEPIAYEEDGIEVVEKFNRKNYNYLHFLTVIDGILESHSAMGAALSDGELKNWIHICQDPEVIDEYSVLPIPTVVEDWDWDYSVMALPINAASEPPVAVSLNNISIFNSYNAFPNDLYTYIWKVNNPWLSFDISKPHVWNYGCPTMVFTTDPSPWGELYSFTYIGRLGEKRSTDLLSTTAMVSVDEQAPSDEIMEKLQWGQLPDKGKIDFEFTDTNVAIDDIIGNNTTHISFDMSRSDWCPPTLQIVRFVDTEDNITDRYDTGEKGVIEFYGGDFTSHYDLETYYSWFTEEPAAEVKVEYAPYGSDNFSPLEVENIPERDFMPGFGTYYRGSLANVDRKSENGWFDVRITLTDAAGNYQEQTLSPAFKIESLTGIDSTFDTVADVRVNGRNIIAPENAQIFSINGIPVNGCDLQPGIYFVTLSGVTTKVLVK